MEKKEEMELETAKNLVLKHMISELNLMPSPGKEDKSKLAMFFTQTLLPLLSMNMHLGFRSMPLSQMALLVN
jgi:hypothetical protein